MITGLDKTKTNVRSRVRYNGEWHLNEDLANYHKVEKDEKTQE